MIHSPEQIRIEYGVIVASEMESMTKLLGDVFSRHDPLAVSAGVTAPEFEAFVGLLSPKVVDEGLTVVARLANTGEVVGALLTEDAASAAPDGMEQLDEKFEPIGEFLRQLVAKYRGDKMPYHGEMLHLYLLGVSDRVARQGVAHGLVTACIENGARRGYRVAVAEATSKVSQHVFRKLGFVPRAQISYEGYLFQGRQVFASIAEHGGSIVMEKSLTLPGTAVSSVPESARSND